MLTSTLRRSERVMMRMVKALVLLMGSVLILESENLEKTNGNVTIAHSLIQ